MSTRRYDASRRQAAASETRQQILDAGRHLFLEQGYAATTMKDVAAVAHVAPATANAAFGGKAGLLKRLIDISIVGDDAELSVAERDAAGAIVREPDAGEQCAMFARLVTEIHQRLAPLAEVVQQASGVDDEMRRLAATEQQGRRQGMAEFVAAIRLDALRPGLDAELATDAVWALTDHRLYMALVAERGWPPEEYANFLSGQLTAALLR